MKFSFDTSVIIEMERRYNRASDPKMWEILEISLQNGTVLISDEVIFELNQLENRGKWVTDNFEEAVIASTKKVQDEVTRLVNTYPINHQSDDNWADPFVVAIAKLYNAKVVTMERVNRHLLDKPHEIQSYSGSLTIPNYCILENIEYLDLTQFIVEVGTFG